MNSDIERVLFSAEELYQRVSELGKLLTEEYYDREPLILCVMKGAMVFTSDLMRQLRRPCELETIAISSYREGVTSGSLVVDQPLSIHITGRDVIVVEDILDTGRTLDYVMNILQNAEPASLKLVTLLDKPSRRVVPLQADLVGFTIPDVFVVGYGLDYNQGYRNLPYIGVLKPSVYH